MEEDAPASCFLRAASANSGGSVILFLESIFRDNPLARLRDWNFNGFGPSVVIAVEAAGQSLGFLSLVGIAGAL